MNMIVIALICNPNRTTKGYRIMDKDTGNIIDVETSKVIGVLKKGTPIEGLKLQAGRVKGSNGSLDRYTKIDTKGKIIDNKTGIIILKAIDDLGYIITDSNANQLNIKKDDLIKMVESDANKTLANGKIVEGPNGKFISSIYGSYEKEELEKIKEKLESNRSANKDIGAETIKKLEKTGDLRNILGRITVSGRQCSLDLIKQHDELSGMDVDQKFVYVEHVIKQVRPFYYYILMSIKKKWSIELPTMGVTSDTLYINPNFVLEMSLPELLFVVLHEIMHIAMSHPYRSNNKDRECWGLAVDYFVNEHLIDEFKLPRNNEPVKILLKSGGVFNKTSTDINKYKIALPESACVNPNVNLAVDTAESLYRELMQLKQEPQSNNQSGNESGQSGQSNQNNQGGQDNNTGKNNQNNGDNEGNQSKQSDKNNGEGSQQGNQEGNQEGSGDTGNDEQNNQNKTLQGKIFRGNEIKGDYGNDIVKDKSEPLTNEQARQVSQAVLARAVTLAKKNIPGWGTDSTDPVERMVIDALAPKINWRSLLKSYLTAASQKVNTFARPDKRFRSRGMIMPGPKQIDNDSLENVKVCIDTSGSISNRDLGVAMAQIKQLLFVYKAKAELIYWDTEVRAIYDFNNVDELLKAIPKGGGGTDPNCIFKYFETDRDYKIGKRHKPSIVLIFTDGYFGTIDTAYTKYKNTIWIINGSNNAFNPPFGKVAPFKVEE